MSNSGKFKSSTTLGNTKWSFCPSIPITNSKILISFQGLSGFCFAFLPFLSTVGGFIGISYLLRFLEGLGTSMAWSSALGILMKIFPNRTAKIMSWTQTCFGLGYMLGND